MALLLLNQKRKKGILLLSNRTFTMISSSINAVEVVDAEEADGNGVNSNSSIYEDMKRACEQGLLKEAVDILHVMDQRGIQVDSYTYNSLLQGCLNMKALLEGKLIHNHMMETGFKPDVFLGTKLIVMYAKCGSLVDARRVLDEMPEQNVVSWTAMIAAYARQGHSEEALTLFSQMQRTSIRPNQFTFASVLPACANSADLEHGKEVHERVIRTGFQSDVFVCSALVDMYSKCGRMQDARQVFDKMPERDEAVWNAMIRGYAQNGQVDEAMKLFRKMPTRNAVSWTVMIAGYAQNGHLDEALQLFQEVPDRNVVLWTVMISGYAQNGNLDEALKLFTKMLERDLVSWNAMVAGYTQNGQFDEALKIFQQMHLAGVKPNSDTFASVLPACANLAALQVGKEVHADITRSGFLSDVFVANSLVDMYAKCGIIEDAYKVFGKMCRRDVVSWNAMMAGYTQNGYMDEALLFFQKMPERNVVSWNAMIAGYTQNGQVDEALNLFQTMPERNIISWNAMIAGYAQNGYFDEALKLFRQMQLEGMKPSADSFASVLPACAYLAALHKGKEVHEGIIRIGFESVVFVGNALVDMYAKCGSIEDARHVFDKMPRRNVISWTAMIVGYAMHGCGKKALQLFEQMQHSDTKPDHVTFIGVLFACCHAGLVDAGWQYFNCMSQDYNITPGMEHYCCMVDLLGRAGHLDKAHDLINKMPIKPDAAVLGCLLGACRIHSNIELGECVAQCLFELDPNNAAHYVLMSNIYAAAGRWDGVEKVRKLMKDRKVQKMPGCSWIEVNNKVYTFTIGNQSHPLMQKIYAKLEELSGQIKEAGYVPDMNFVLRNVEEEQKEHILCHHSEKLAIVFGLMSTSHRTPIRVVKNLRVCGDCHSATKFITKIVAREIVVRDAKRFHHFKDGRCSCGDYW